MMSSQRTRKLLYGKSSAMNVCSAAHVQIFARRVTA